MLNTGELLCERCLEPFATCDIKRKFEPSVVSIDQSLLVDLASLASALIDRDGTVPCATCDWIELKILLECLTLS